MRIYNILIFEKKKKYICCSLIKQIKKINKKGEY